MYKFNSFTSKWIFLVIVGFCGLIYLAFNYAPTPPERNLTTFVLDGNTNEDGHFIIPHGIKVTSEVGENFYRIYGILVAIQHPNGAWNTIDTSNQYNNTFFWNNERVEGWINRPDKTFGRRPVRIIVFALRVVG